MSFNSDYEITAAMCRKEANSVSEQIYSNQEIEAKIIQRTSDFHNRIQKTSAYSKTGNHDKYNIAQLAITKAVAADLLSTIEEFKEDAEKKLREYRDIVKSIHESKSFYIASAGVNIADELNPDNYTHLPSGNPGSVNL